MAISGANKLYTEKRNSQIWNSELIGKMLIVVLPVFAKQKLQLKKLLLTRRIPNCDRMPFMLTKSQKFIECFNNGNWVIAQGWLL